MVVCIVQRCVWYWCTVECTVWICVCGCVYSTEMRVVLVVCTVWRCVCGSVYNTEVCVCVSVYSTDTEVCVCVCFGGRVVVMCTVWRHVWYW